MDDEAGGRSGVEDDDVGALQDGHGLALYGGRFEADLVLRVLGGVQRFAWAIGELGLENWLAVDGGLVDAGDGLAVVVDFNGLEGRVLQSERNLDNGRVEVRALQENQVAAFKLRQHAAGRNDVDGRGGVQKQAQCNPGAQRDGDRAGQFFGEFLPVGGVLELGVKQVGQGANGDQGEDDVLRRAKKDDAQYQCRVWQVVADKVTGFFGGSLRRHALPPSSRPTLFGFLFLGSCL